MVQRNELETTQEEVEKYKKKYFDGEKRITDLTSQLNKTSEELISSSEDSKALSQIKAQMKGENDILQNQLTDLEVICIIIYLDQAWATKIPVQDLLKGLVGALALKNKKLTYDLNKII